MRLTTPQRRSYHKCGIMASNKSTGDVLMFMGPVVIYLFRSWYAQELLPHVAPSGGAEGSYAT
jgi:hypothetical protein